MPTRRRRLSALAILLAVALVLPAPSLAGSPKARGQAGPTSGPSDADGQLLPTIHYEDAQRHANDRIAFLPGERVRVPFKPRPSDDWSVGGRAPRELPAGRKSGQELAAAETGKHDAAPEPVATPRPDLTAEPEASPAPAVDPTAPDALTPERTLSARVGSDGLRREVFGFLPYWELYDSNTRLDYSVLSTIAYFGVGADKNGHLTRKRSDGTTDTGWAGWTSSALTNVIDAAHARGTRVVLTVQRFGWTSSQSSDTTTLLSSASARATLANEIAGAVRDRGADGVNLDFEPIPGGQGANYVTFVRQVRAALDARAPGYQLTFDTTGWIGNYDVAALTAAGAADAVFIMGYDYRTSSSGSAGSISPLSGPAYDLNDTVANYLERTSASKIILGVPYFGRAWSTTTDALHAPTRPGSSSYGYSSSVLYTTAVNYAAAQGRRWDATEQVPWSAYQWQYCSTCPTTWRQLYFDDAQSLGLKYDLVNQRNLRGAGIWALGYDDTRTELYATLKTKFLEDKTPPRAGVITLSETSRDEGIRVRWKGQDDWGDVTLHDVQVSADGGPWSAWLTSTQLTSATYLGRDGHGYAFRVRARDAHANWSTWGVAETWRATAAALGPGGFARVVAGNGLNLREDASGASAWVGLVPVGTRLSVLEGPVMVGGYPWYHVGGPLGEWDPVAATLDGWVIGGSSTADNIAAARAPNTTAVDAVVAGLDLSAAAFSPNGDGAHDALRIAYRLDRALDGLGLRVYRAADRSPVGSRWLPGLGAGQGAYNWDGTLGGERLPDGAYILQLVGTVGSAVYSAPAADMTDPLLPVAAVTFVIDTMPPTTATPAVAPGRFSPNGDGRYETTRFSSSATNGALTWSLRVTSGSGAAVRSWSGSGSSWAATWDGRNAAGTRVADGTYTITASARDALGNTDSATASVVVDTRGPTGTVKSDVPGFIAGATAGAFSPNGDRWQDSTALRWTLGEVGSGTLSVLRGSTLVWSATLPSSSTGALAWAGRDRYGRAVAEGSYTVLARLVDSLGNRSTVTGRVIVDRTAGYLTATPTLFYPQDGDALAPSSRLSFALTRTATTTLRVTDAAGHVVRTAWAKRSLVAGTRMWTWDGRTDAGAFVPVGYYRVTLFATANGVTTATPRTVHLDAFEITPSKSVLTAGETLSVRVLTAESLLSAPSVKLTQAGLASVTKATVRTAPGVFTATFTIAPGGNGTATLVVSATDGGGRTNISRATVTVE